MDMLDQGETENDIICKSYFFHLWRTDILLRNITIPKVSRFSRCDTCMLIKNKLASSKTASSRASTVKLRDLHLEEQNEERRKYYKHITKAKRSPKQYVSLIVDGMDQAKTNLPHFVEVSKTAGSMWKLKVHVTGVIAHGIGHFGFFDVHQWPHGSSLTISIIQNLLKMLKEVPKVLYLQMDNCCRENKNRFLMAYLCYLVEMKIFDKIKLSFLMVGHTHEDVDQMFSRFSVGLKKRACLTLPKLMQCFEDSFSPRPQAILLNEVFNVGDWLHPNLDKMWGHSGPHAFKVFRDNSGKAMVVYKDWTTDKIWKRTADPLLKVTPVGEPQHLEAKYNEEEMSYLEESVKKCYRFFRREGDKEWWEELFRNGCIEDKALGAQFGVNEICCITDTTPMVEEEQAELDEELKAIKMKSTPIPPVVIGRKLQDQQNTGEDTVNNIKTGDMCLLNVPRYAGEWPQIGKVLEIFPQDVSIQWYKGSKTGQWSPCTVPIPKQRGKRMPWIEKIPLDQIWFSGFSFTPSRNLPSSVRSLLDNYNEF